MISELEKGAFISLFNRNGYVLNFSTASFDAFTVSSVGVAVCARYGYSKGKSLAEYVKEASDDDVLKLYVDLLEYYESFCIDNPGEQKYSNLYDRCKRIITREQNEKVYVETPAITCVNRDYIKNIAARAMNDVDEGNYDSAITKSRTLLEEVFCYAIELKHDTPSDSGKINTLYGQVKDLYGMRQSPSADSKVNHLLSGLEKIVTAIAEMRNDSSDSHGVGEKRITLEGYQARLFVNASMTMADYILSVVKNGEIV